MHDMPWFFWTPLILDGVKTLSLVVIALQLIRITAVVWRERP